MDGLRRGGLHTRFENVEWVREYCRECACYQTCGHDARKCENYGQPAISARMHLDRADARRACAPECMQRGGNASTLTTPTNNDPIPRSLSLVPIPRIPLTGQPRPNIFRSFINSEVKARIRRVAERGSCESLKETAGARGAVDV